MRRARRSGEGQGRGRSKDCHLLQEKKSRSKTRDDSLPYWRHYNRLVQSPSISVLRVLYINS